MDRTRIYPLHADSDRSVDMKEYEFIERKKVTTGVVKSEEELLDRTSDAIKEHAHAIAMLKKACTLQTELTPEDVDKAVEKELKKAWNEVKDLTLEGYVMRIYGEMLMDGFDPEGIFGEEDGKEDR